ncbi:hypothetical protein ACFX2G_047854 [Malus domestica]
MSTTVIGVFTILRVVELHEDLEVNEAEGHEADSESGHHAGEAYQAYDYKHVQKELHPAAGHHRSHLRRSLAWLLESGDQNLKPTSLNSPSSPDPHRCAYWIHSRVLNPDSARLTCPFSHQKMEI